MTADETVNGLLIVVAQDESGMYRNLRERFEGRDMVRIVLDRRLGHRRKISPSSPDRERRAADRRAQSDIEDRLRSLGYAMISVFGRAPTPPPPPQE